MNDSSRWLKYGYLGRCHHNLSEGNILAFVLKSRGNQEDSSVKIADKDITLTWQCLITHFLTCSVIHIKKLMKLYNRNYFNIPLLLYLYYFLFYSCSCIKNKTIKINNIQHWNHFLCKCCFIHGIKIKLYHIHVQGNMLLYMKNGHMSCCFFDC